MLCILSLFPPTIHQSHNIPLLHFIMRMHIFPAIFFHILNLCLYLYFLSQRKITLILYMFMCTLFFNFNVLSNYQNHCMVMPISYHMYSVTLATNFTFKFSSFTLLFVLHSLWCVLITYVYWNVHNVLTVWETLTIIIFVHPHNKIFPITKYTGPWMYQNLIFSIISANTATGS